ncbi:MAG: TIGR02281 family clan AA aspartic protease [Betaproteobacteria bacterium]
MATGFMESGGKVMRHFTRAFALYAALCAALVSGASWAVSVTLVGLFPGKAVVVIDGQEPRTLSAGQKTVEGVTLVSTASETAVFDIGGKRQTLDLGQHFAPASDRAGSVLAIAADGQGHHWTVGQVNGKSTRFLIDTGATTVSLPAGFAKAAGIDYQKGQRGFVQTANGPAVAYRVKLDALTVGEITVYQIDATVLESGLDIALLGMSFLSRTDMKRDGANLVLTKRF